MIAYKVSVLTVVLNREEVIERCIDSVAKQTYGDIEHVIVDGVSTDNTTSLIKKLLKSSDSIVFESSPDKGIYNALNKAIKLSSGSIICVLHSDDIFEDKHVIQRMVDKFYSSPSLDLIYADVVFFKNNTTNIVRKYSSKIFSKDRIRNGIIPAHTSCFIKRSVYERYGLYDENYRIAGDFEFFARIFKHKINALYCQKVLIRMSVGGLSTNGSMSHFIINREILRALRTNKIDSSLFKILVRYIYKIFEIKWF